MANHLANSKAYLSKLQHRDNIKRVHIRLHCRKALSILVHQPPGHNVAVPNSLDLQLQATCLDRAGATSARCREIDG